MLTITKHTRQEFLELEDVKVEQEAYEDVVNSIPGAVLVPFKQLYGTMLPESEEEEECRHNHLVFRDENDVYLGSCEEFVFNDRISMFSFFVTSLIDIKEKQAPFVDLKANKENDGDWCLCYYDEGLVYAMKKRIHEEYPEAKIYHVSAF